MSEKTKKVVGIWIDKSHAYVFAAPDRSAKGDFALVSKLDIDDHKDDVHKNERTDLSKEKQELRKTYKEIEKLINNDDVIYIFGPGQAQEQLRNHLEDEHHYKQKEIVLGTSGQLTQSQMIDHLEKHFG
jgi:stalled ribosome rescue protein Dom34